MSASVDIVEARVPEDMGTVRELFREYAAELQVDLCFQGFEEELAALPDSYARPRGAIWLARVNGQAVGCIALRPLDDNKCEVKRLYVKSQYRATGAGRRLATTLIAHAQSLGYHEALLDTLTTMGAARALYASLGFEPTTPYYHNPLPGVIYMVRRFT
jgi:putative acetyltransferase